MGLRKFYVLGNFYNARSLEPRDGTLPSPVPVAEIPTCLEETLGCDSERDN